MLSLTMLRPRPPSLHPVWARRVMEKPMAISRIICCRTMRNRAMKKKRKQVARTTPKPSKVAQYILSRLFGFNVASSVLFILAGIFLLSRLEEISQRIDNLPSWFTWAFNAVWALSTVYRLYLSATQNPKLSQIAANDNHLRRYSLSQVTSTLVSLLLVTSAVLYLSGLLQPIVDIVASFLETVDPAVVGAALSILGTVFWGVVSCAIWELIKLTYKRFAAPTLAPIGRK